MNKYEKKLFKRINKEMKDKELSITEYEAVMNFIKSDEYIKTKDGYLNYLNFIYNKYYITTYEYYNLRSLA